LAANSPIQFLLEGAGLGAVLLEPVARAKMVDRPHLEALLRWAAAGADAQIQTMQDGVEDRAAVQVKTTLEGMRQEVVAK